MKHLTIMNYIMVDLLSVTNLLTTENSYGSAWIIERISFGRSLSAFYSLSDVHHPKDAINWKYFVNYPASSEILLVDTQSDNPLRLGTIYNFRRFFTPGSTPI